MMMLSFEKVPLLHMKCLTMFQKDLLDAESSIFMKIPFLKYLAKLQAS